VSGGIAQARTDMGLRRCRAAALACLLIVLGAFTQAHAQTDPVARPDPIPRPGSSQAERLDSVPLWFEALSEDPFLRRPYVPPPPIERLRVMVLSLQDLVPPEDETGVVSPRGQFRHTFGSQRNTREEHQQIAFDPGRVDADIVLLRGVERQALLRRLFPARSWRVVLSRARIVVAREAGEIDGDSPAATAVAIRLQPGMRFAGVDPGMARALGTSARVNIGKRTVWLLATAGCTSGQDDVQAPRSVHRLPACSQFEDCIQGHLASGDMVVAGGGLAGLGEVREPEAATGANAMARLEVDTSTRTSAPIPDALDLGVRVDGVRQVRAEGPAERCADNGGGRPGIHLWPASILDARKSDQKPAPYKMLSWVVPLPQPIMTGGAAKPGSAPSRQQRACALVIQVAP